MIILWAVALPVSGGLAAACGSQHPAAPPAARCGSAVTHFVTADTQIFAARRGALTCFATAARHCRAASLSVTAVGVDTGSHYVFTIAPGGSPCRVTETSQFYSANGGGSQGPLVTRSCRMAGVTGQGVTLTCGGQTVLIPAKATRPVPGV